MFPLRCLFWLSIVYGSITWPPGALQGSAPSPAVAAKSLASNLSQSALGSLRTYCRAHAAECLADAARLQALVAASDTGGSKMAAVTTQQAPALAAEDGYRRKRSSRPAH